MGKKRLNSYSNNTIMKKVPTRTDTLNDLCKSVYDTVFIVLADGVDVWLFYDWYITQCDKANWFVDILDISKTHQYIRCFSTVNDKEFTIHLLTSQQALAGYNSNGHDPDTSVVWYLTAL